MKIHLVVAAAMACAMTTVLAACGGGDGPTLSQQKIDKVRADPRVRAAERIAERANKLVIPAAYFDMTISAQGQTERINLELDGSCQGTRCRLSGDGESLSIGLDDLLTPSAELEYTRLELGSRGGFDTVIAEGRSQVTEGISGSTFTVSPSVHSYGLWGQHGFAAIEFMQSPLSGRVDGIPFTGNLTGAMSYTFGNATGSNPSGFGGATWHGISEAVSTSHLERRHGTATISIADLSRPRVAVDIDIAGYQIGSSSWNSIPVYQGQYSTGRYGYDLLVGDFYGPGHQETYGTFDTGTYVGSFGAVRE